MTESEWCVLCESAHIVGGIIGSSVRGCDLGEACKIAGIDYAQKETSRVFLLAKFTAYASYDDCMNASRRCIRVPKDVKLQRGVIESVSW